MGVRYASEVASKHSVRSADDSQSWGPCFDLQLPTDGAVIELTGTSPQIHFGPELAPVCSLFLDAVNSRLQSTCDISTPSGSGRRRMGAEEAFTSSSTYKEVEVLIAQQKELKDEIAELRRELHELVK